MARSHARLLLRVWSDPEWRALAPPGQWLYWLLISQPGLNHAGVLTLPGNRWSSLSAGATREYVEEALALLAEQRFVVVDVDTDEVLVRTYIRNDEVSREPNTFKSALRSAQAVQSPLLRRALLEELRRLDEYAIARMRVPKGHLSILELYQQTVKMLDPQDPEPAPPNINNATPSEGYAEPYDVPNGVGKTVGIYGRGVVSTSPPVDSYSPPEQTHTHASRSKRDPEPDGFADFWNAYPRKIAKRAAAKAYDAAVKRGAEPAELITAARRYAHATRGHEARFIAHPATWLNQGRHEDEPDPTPTAENKTDARIRALLADDQPAPAPYLRAIEGGH